MKTKETTKQTTKQQLHLLIDTDLLDKLETYCEDTGLTKSVVLRKSLEEYLKTKMK